MIIVMSLVVGFQIVIDRGSLRSPGSSASVFMNSDLPRLPQNSRSSFVESVGTRLADGLVRGSVVYTHCSLSIRMLRSFGHTRAAIARAHIMCMTSVYERPCP